MIPCVILVPQLSFENIFHVIFPVTKAMNRVICISAFLVKGRLYVINEINSWIRHIASNYILIIAAAVIFFAIKAVIGFYTYKHYNKKLDHLHHKVDLLMKEQQHFARPFSPPDENKHMTQKEDHVESSPPPLM